MTHQLPTQTPLPVSVDEVGAGSPRPAPHRPTSQHLPRLRRGDPRARQAEVSIPVPRVREAAVRPL